MGVAGVRKEEHNRMAWGMVDKLALEPFLLGFEYIFV